MAKDDGKITPNGAEIKRQRKLKGFTQESLSHESGVTLKTIRSLETKTGYRCKPLTINTLAQALELDPASLILTLNSGPKLLLSPQEIIKANVDIVNSAEQILVCVGARSRDKQYLDKIEKALNDRPNLIHYRILPYPPFKKVLQDHLLNIVEIRDPADRSRGYKTIHVGLFDNLLKQPEMNLCANETKALIVLPSIQGINEYNTALLIENPDTSQSFVRVAKSLYQDSHKLETAEAILEIGLLENGEIYE